MKNGLGDLCVTDIDRLTAIIKNRAIQLPYVTSDILIVLNWRVYT